MTEDVFKILLETIKNICCYGNTYDPKLVIPLLNLFYKFFPIDKDIFIQCSKIYIDLKLKDYSIFEWLKDHKCEISHKDAKEIEDYAIKANNFKTLKWMQKNDLYIFDYCSFYYV